MSMFTTYKAVVAACVSLLILQGCDNSSTAIPEEKAEDKPDEVVSTPLLTGYFTDISISGLPYRTQSHEGVTNSQGQYQYRSNEDITFYLGDTDLFSFAAKEKYSIEEDLIEFELPEVFDSHYKFGCQQTFINFSNVASILFTLDDDIDLTNGITIPAGIPGLFKDKWFNLFSPNDRNVRCGEEPINLVQPLLHNMSFFNILESAYATGIYSEQRSIMSSIMVMNRFYKLLNKVMHAPSALVVPDEYRSEFLYSEFGDIESYSSIYDYDPNTQYLLEIEYNQFGTKIASSRHNWQGTYFLTGAIKTSTTINEQEKIIQFGESYFDIGNEYRNQIQHLIQRDINEDGLLETTLWSTFHENGKLNTQTSDSDANGEYDYFREFNQYGLPLSFIETGFETEYTWDLDNLSGNMTHREISSGIIENRQYFILSDDFKVIETHYDEDGDGVFEYKEIFDEREDGTSSTTIDIPTELITSYSQVQYTKDSIKTYYGRFPADDGSFDEVLERVFNLYGHLTEEHFSNTHKPNSTKLYAYDKYGRATTIIQKIDDGEFSLIEDFNHSYYVDEYDKELRINFRYYVDSQGTKELSSKTYFNADGLPEHYYSIYNDTENLRMTYEYNENSQNGWWYMLHGE